MGKVVPTGSWCPACGRAVDQFLPGPNRRPNASCPHCGSLERHRFLALLLEGLGPVIASSHGVLDVAPSPQIAQVLQRLAPRYIRMDLDPNADRRAVDVQASITQAPFAEGTFDVVVCYHVFEHVPDDAAGMRELRRILSPGGFALVQVPWKPDVPTDEDPEAPVEERVRRFGQADHVRYYGDDFEDRLRRAGLDVTRLTPPDVVGEACVARLRLMRDESVWVVRRAGAEPDAVRVPGEALRLSLARHLEDQTEQVTGLEQRLRVAERAAARYHELRRMWPVRVAAVMSRPVRRRRRRRRT